MKYGGALALLVCALLAAGCGDHADRKNNTAVLGGYGHGGASAPALTDAQGRTIPSPPAPPLSTPQVVRSADEQALAVWVQDGHVVSSTWTPAQGWTPAQPLEQIYGESSDVRIASNGHGQAMAVWHHRVGNIHSLRFSRLEAPGWSTPDVLPGALPRPAVPGAPPGQDAPQLQMDAQGNVTARWPSGFHANEEQLAHYTPADGWTHPASEPVASAPSASPPPRAPSSAP